MSSILPSVNTNSLFHPPSSLSVKFIIIILQTCLHHFTVTSAFCTWWNAAPPLTSLPVLTKHATPPNPVTVTATPTLTLSPYILPPPICSTQIYGSPVSESILCVCMCNYQWLHVYMYLSEEISKYMCGYQDVWTCKCGCAHVGGCVCVCVVCEWSLAYVTHHIDGSQPCGRLALLLGVTERLVVVGLLEGEQGWVDQVPHEDRVNGTKEGADLRTSGVTAHLTRTFYVSIKHKWRHADVMGQRVNRDV